MDEILKRITEYRIFNFLLPGAVFTYAVSATTTIPLDTDDILLSFFLYYFIGLVISRVGSVIIEPILKLLKMVDFAPYDKFVKASKLDDKINTFSQENNTYRTLLAAAVCYLAIYLLFIRHSDEPANAYILLLTVAFIILFVFSYRKQTGYVKDRIGIALKK